MSSTVEPNVKQWGIREMPPAAREAAVAAAEAAGMKIGDWLAQAIEIAIHLGPLADLSVEARNAAVFAAGKNGIEPGEYVTRAILAAIRAEREENRQPALRAPALAAPGQAPALSISGLQEAIQAASSLATASGKPMSPKIVRALNKGLLAHLGS